MKMDNTTQIIVVFFYFLPNVTFLQMLYNFLPHCSEVYVTVRCQVSRNNSLRFIFVFNCVYACVFASAVAHRGWRKASGLDLELQTRCGSWEWNSGPLQTSMCSHLLSCFVRLRTSFFLKFLTMSGLSLIGSV